ncbi:uncharacterized protein MYCFIDRAFT_176725 [Pseudocercospora fijiensis CIRAD86]|uniref:Uncharacterized protein n=1 Tax=Pseudocercospora fijiensis (strain CIRAD86) TaxID=383855 RepID=M2ZQU2_PSEFD|nr:uncharacterized protein MYCFIDRAFT_176725 [Pseudocercospora fijiensis CIRAD86]EME81449.1 hypothetical protein MYCFIDRAFT_176725 [Pseudocercospora fijiensis CIRAD86]
MGQKPRVQYSRCEMEVRVADPSRDRGLARSVRMMEKEMGRSLPVTPTSDSEQSFNAAPALSMPGKTSPTPHTIFPPDSEKIARSSPPSCREKISSVEFAKDQILHETDGRSQGSTIQRRIFPLNWLFGGNLVRLQSVIHHLTPRLNGDWKQTTRLTHLSSSLACSTQDHDYELIRRLFKAASDLVVFSHACELTWKPSVSHADERRICLGRRSLCMYDTHSRARAAMIHRKHEKRHAKRSKIKENVAQSLNFSPYESYDHAVLMLPSFVLQRHAHIHLITVTGVSILSPHISVRFTMIRIILLSDQYRRLACLFREAGATLTSLTYSVQCFGIGECTGPGSSFQGSSTIASLRSL